MGIKTVLHRPYSPDLVPCDFWLFPKLRGYRYETIEEMKEAVTKVIDSVPQEAFHGALKKLLEQYNKCIAAGGDSGCLEYDTKLHLMMRCHFYRFSSVETALLPLLPGPPWPGVA